MIFLLLPFLRTSPGMASTDVYYAGFAYSGRYADVQSNFKYTQMINEVKEGRSYLDKLFGDFFIKNKSFLNGIDLKVGELVSTKTSSKIVMVVAVTREGITVDDLSGTYKITANLFCQVVFMDFDDKKIVSSYPLYVEYIDATAQKPDDAYIAEIIRKVYASAEFGIIRLIEERMGAFKVGVTGVLSAQIADVHISEKALKQLTNDTESIGSYSNAISHQYSDILSSQLGIPVLPPSRDCLGAKISLVFSDATAQDFQLPAPAYSIDVTLDDLQVKVLEENPVETALALGVFLRVRVYEKEYNRVFFDKQIIHGSSKNVPKTQASVNQTEAFFDTIRIAMEKSIKEMKKDKRANKKFLKPCLKYSGVNFEF